MREGLTPEEDDALRCLEALMAFGPLVGETAERHSELLRRDRRTSVRPPRSVASSTPSRSD